MPTSPELTFNRNAPKVFASPAFVEAADFIGTVGITVDPFDLAATVNMARSSRGRPLDVGAVTLELTDEHPHIHIRSPLLHPITPDTPLDANEPVRLRDVRRAANEQDMEVLRLTARTIDEAGLQRAAYLAAVRKPALWFGSMGGLTLGLAAYVIESGVRGDPSLARVAAYVGTGALLGTVGHPLLSRGKYRYDQPLLANRNPIQLERQI